MQLLSNLIIKSLTYEIFLSGFLQNIQRKLKFRRKDQFIKQNFRKSSWMQAFKKLKFIRSCLRNVAFQVLSETNHFKKG